MTFKALIDGIIHEPIAEVLCGEMTAKECDERYRGIVGFCPDCENLLGDQSFADLIAGKDRSIIYHRGSYDSDGTLVRSMHFEHRPGYAHGGKTPCSHAGKYLHDLALKLINKRELAKMPIGTTSFIDADVGFHRPDISFFNADGQEAACIEYQRSPEPFRDFLRRHQLRCRRWPATAWYFDRAIYERASTKIARDYLAAEGKIFYVCDLNITTLQFKVEEGTAANYRDSKKYIRLADDRICPVAERHEPHRAPSPPTRKTRPWQQKVLYGPVWKSQQDFENLSDANAVIYEDEQYYTRAEKGRKYGSILLLNKGLVGADQVKWL